MTCWACCINSCNTGSAYNLPSCWCSKQDPLLLLLCRLQVFGIKQPANASLPSGAWRHSDAVTIV